MMDVWGYFFESWLWSIAGALVGYLIGRAERTHLDHLDENDNGEHHDHS